LQLSDSEQGSQSVDEDVQIGSAGGDHTERPPSWLLTDRPVHNDQADQLGLGVFADALADLIDRRATATPLTVAVNGSWGSGKTSLVKLVEQRLGVLQDWPKPHLVCWFNAWMHDDAPRLGAALAAAVAHTVDRHRPWWRRRMRPVSLELLSPQTRWFRRLVLVALVVVLAVVAVAVLPEEVLLAGQAGRGFAARDSASGLAAAVVLLTLIAGLASRLYRTADAVVRFVDDPRSEASRGAMAGVREDLGVLVGQALRGQRRLLIVVDDLDRCSGPRALELCQVASQLLDHPGVVTVLVGDMRPLAEAAAGHFAELSGGPATGAERGWAYVQRLVQLSMTLPPARVDDIRNVIRAADGVGRAADTDYRSSFGERLRPAVRRARERAEDIVWRRLLWHALVAIPVAGLALFVDPLLIALFGSDAGEPGVTSDSSGAALARDIRGFVAPLAAIIISMMGIRYLFGPRPQRSAFVGFLLLGLAVYALISYGDEILGRLGNVLILLWSDDQSELAPLPRPGPVEWRPGPGDITVAVVAVIATLAAGIQVIPGYRARQRGEQIESTVRELLGAGEDPSGVRVQVTRRFGSVEAVRRRIERHLIEEAPGMQAAAQDEIESHLPRNPRAAKQLVNHLRLGLLIASGRDMFNSDVTTKPRQVAKLVVLSTRWPWLAAILTECPGELAKLEAAARANKFELFNTTIAKLTDMPGADDLREFLRHGVTLGHAAGHAAEELIYFSRPASVDDQ